ncbi:Hypothetical predicted protein [Pelobates cultripes]|uniref:Uncharacterized protein n=1 Tax=Pelobates cultripes TaxID=61616 RepID=A0AAD1T7X6_PELCU|nr:Hypothetical predicted protein [Pelobates cultripes]
MEYFLIFISSIDSLFSSLCSVSILWILSVFCLKKLEESDRVQAKQIKHATGTTPGANTDKNRSSSVGTSIENAEKFLTLFDGFLVELDSVTERHPSLQEHIQNLQRANKELQKIQIVMESLKTRFFYGPVLDVYIKYRIHRLLAKFEHTKAYIDLRLYLLKASQGQFEAWLCRSRLLKMWLAESLSLQESVHNMECDSQADIRKHLQIQKVLSAESARIGSELEIYKKDSSNLENTLQEISSWSKKFELFLGAKMYQNGTKRWNEVLSQSISDEMDQVCLRFLTLTNLVKCYQIHLEGLSQMLQTQNKVPRTPRASITNIPLSITATK